MYTNSTTFTYYSERYDKHITVKGFYRSDGATGGLDVCHRSFYVHDWLCGNWLEAGPKPPKGLFDDGTKCTNWQASTIHSDILRDCARQEKGFIKIFLYLMSLWRWPVTFIFGGGQARKNGMFKELV